MPTDERPVVFYLPCVEALDMPRAVEEWCLENDISIHYAEEIHCVHDDGNPLAEWLKAHGVVFDKDFIRVGVLGD